jgi:hypothetical protein
MSFISSAVVRGGRQTNKFGYKPQDPVVSPKTDQIVTQARAILLSQGPQLCRVLGLSNNQKLCQKIQVSSIHSDFILHGPQHPT